MAVPPARFMLPAVMAAARDEVLGPLRGAGATAPERAVPLAVDDGAKGAVMRSLLRRGILVEVRPGRYYLDEAEMARRRRADLSVVFGLILVLTAIAVAAVLLLAG